MKKASTKQRRLLLPNQNMLLLQDNSKFQDLGWDAGVIENLKYSSPSGLCTDSGAADKKYDTSAKILISDMTSLIDSECMI